MPLKKKMRISNLLSLFSVFLHTHYYCEAAFEHGQEIDYLALFDSIDDASYAAVDDSSSSAPSELLEQCKKSGSTSTPTNEVYLSGNSGTIFNSGVILSSSATAQCDSNSICIVPDGLTLKMDESLNVGALVIRGSLEWNDFTVGTSQSTFLCAGYVAVEENGSFQMDIQQQNQSAWIYLKDNGATHSVLRNRSFGSAAIPDSNDNPTVNIKGRELIRTWSLLSNPLLKGETTMKLMHNPTFMGWSIGDRIAIAPTELRSTGVGQDFRIQAISNSGIITLSKAAQYDFDAEFYPPLQKEGNGGEAALKSAEVVNLDRSIVITGDDFSHVMCDPNLPEAVPGEQTSVYGCRCAHFRNKCTVGLHTAQMNGGEMQIQNTRVEKCGQRGVEGKYCLHFHQLKACKNCLFRNNAIENSHQRGIIVHGTHLSTTEGNTLYNVRGAGVYIEDGNEMYNYIKYNINICPFPFKDTTLHGCTVPGTSNAIADTSDNQSGFFALAATNDMIGNRAANSFNGMFLKAGGVGRGSNYNKVCESDARIGRTEGNVFHGHLRFGTYTLGGNYPKVTDQTIFTNGHNIDKSLCEGFDVEGNTRGISASFKNHLDYHNAFVGHYEAGDIQYNGHKSYENLNLMYWKETKNFQNGCSAHISNSHYAKGNLALPDFSTFIIENTIFGDGVSLEPNHHCNVGITGGLCMPQYVLHDVRWENHNQGKKWVLFQSENTQGHNANQSHGGVFTLSPPNADTVMGGTELPASFFPPGYVSLVSSKFNYLLNAPNNACVKSTTLGSYYGQVYYDSILCKKPLRTLKLFSRGLVSYSAPQLKLEVWFNNEGLAGQDLGGADVSQMIGFHQVGGNDQTLKQGYALPVIPGSEQSYRLSLNRSDSKIPLDWVIEFSDVVIGNRWNDEQIYLSLEGPRSCGTSGLVSSRHDRRFLWSGDAFMEDAWGKHGACISTGTSPNDMPIVDCVGDEDNGILEPTECGNLCQNKCGNNSYCDCGTLECNCKAGFAGEDCSIDLCAAARCGENGTCSARYLGTSLPVTSDKACICDDGWSGELCQLNPCEGIDCSGNGKCVAYGNHSLCKCNPGYSGNDCENSCEGICTGNSGNYPYGCADNLPGVVKYGCKALGCYYLGTGQEYPHDGICTYLDVEDTLPCQCPSENDCEDARLCLSDGSCPDPVLKPDGSFCNSIPWGVCEDGICKASTYTPSPTVLTDEPTSMPTPNAPSPISSPSPTAPTDQPTSTPTSSPTIPKPTPPCGCNDCTQQVLDTLSGIVPNKYTCGARIDYLQQHDGLTELDACRRVAHTEFPCICGPMCDPDQCDGQIAPSPVTPDPTYIPDEPSDSLYCFPDDSDRVTFNNVWSDYTVQVKEAVPKGSACGPGDNIFSSSLVSMPNSNELMLEFKRNASTGHWEASEVRIIRANDEPFSYGTYSFSVGSVSVVDSVTQDITSDLLPKEMVLGLFTWDDVDRYDVNQNWNHEVDVEVSRWDDETNADTQFLVQPTGTLQTKRFFSGSDNNGYDQSNHVHSFTWLPGAISWLSTAGGGQTHEYTTENAMSRSCTDYVQCLPAHMEVRINLWNKYGNKRPGGLLDTQVVKVVIKEFKYIESNESHIQNGGSCSKHCQCEVGCVNNYCVGEPTRSPTVLTSLPTSSPTDSPTSNPTDHFTSNPTDNPTSNPTKSPTLCKDDNKWKLKKNNKKYNCSSLFIKKNLCKKKGSKKVKGKDACPIACSNEKGCTIPKCYKNNAWSPKNGDFDYCSDIKSKNKKKACVLIGTDKLFGYEACKQCNRCNK